MRKNNRFPLQRAAGFFLLFQKMAVFSYHFLKMPLFLMKYYTIFLSLICREQRFPFEMIDKPNKKRLY